MAVGSRVGEAAARVAAIFAITVCAAAVEMAFASGVGGGGSVAGVQAARSRASRRVRVMRFVMGISVFLGWRVSV
jgi:hypothetical protein